jgi:hypothetical protein
MKPTRRRLSAAATSPLVMPPGLGMVLAPAGGGARAQARGGELVGGESTRLARPDHRVTTAQVDSTVAVHVFEALPACDDNAVPQPHLAEGVTIPNHRLVCAFRLREGVRFHNGDTMDAGDVPASFRRHARISPGKSLPSNIASLDAPDPLTFVIALRTPQPLFLETIAARQDRPVIMPPRTATSKPARTRASEQAPTASSSMWRLGTSSSPVSRTVFPTPALTAPRASAASAPVLRHHRLPRGDRGRDPGGRGADGRDAHLRRPLRRPGRRMPVGRYRVAFARRHGKRLGARRGGTCPAPQVGDAGRQFPAQGGRPSDPTASVQTRKPVMTCAPKVRVSGTSAASRPLAIRIRPMRREVLRGPDTHHRPSGYTSMQAAKSIGP